MQAAKDGHAGATAETGPWMIGLDQPSYTAVMTYADNRCAPSHAWPSPVQALSSWLDSTVVFEWCCCFLRGHDTKLCRTLRQEVYTAYETRASYGSTDNSPVVEQIMSLRQQQAQLAGYSSAADYLMSNKVGPAGVFCDTLALSRGKQID